jgi:hypothetical protein
MPTDGSPEPTLFGTVLSTHVKPLSREMATPWLPVPALQDEFGTYTVPSGPTFTWPWMPP